MEGRGFKKYLKANEKKGGALLQCIYEGTFLDGKKIFLRVRLFGFACPSVIYEGTF